MIRVPLVLPPSLGLNNSGSNNPELARLEAERDRLLSMIAYQNGKFYRPRSRSFALMVVVAIGIGVLIMSGILLGASALLFLVVALPALAYISTRKIAVFGNTVLVGEILSLFLGVVTPVGRPVGEMEAHQRLADCEARILKLKEGRS